MKTIIAILMATTSMCGQYEPTRPPETFQYAPAVLNDGTMYYCGNPGNSEITDWIISRTPSGTEQAALKPTAGAWDSRHTCDPDVVRGVFQYNGGTYNWLMLYTGTQDPLNNGGGNSIGAAVSNDQVNWVKTGKLISPTSGAGQWGAGQPAVTSVDGQGKVMVFYTEDGKGVQVRYMNLTNLNSPVTLAGPWSSGLGHNADVVYEPSTDRFYASFPSRYNAAHPSYVAVEETVAWASGSAVWGGNATWNVVKSVSVDDKTHNSGIQHNDYGMLTTTQINLYVTASSALPWPDSLWDYRVSRVTITK